MRLSRFYLPLLKEDPSDTTVLSHRLMLRAGMIKQTSQGLYVLLPLALRVLKKIEHIVRNGLDKIGCNEILMPTIQGADLWRESGRYDDYGEEMLRIKDRHGKEMLYGPTNEEVATHIFRSDVSSYRQLPVNLYQIQWKFRDEIRPRFGLMRAREFLMMDAYSFDANKDSAIATYNTYYKAYLEIFKNMGLVAIPLAAKAGAIGGNLSHEFQIVAENGESEIYYDKGFESFMSNPESYNTDLLQAMYAKSDDEHDPSNCPENVICKRGIEVGHIFYFGTKYSQTMRAEVADASGGGFFPEMGSYGIGMTRLIAAAIEAFNDKYGIVWPRQISPFDIHLINLDPEDRGCLGVAEEIYSVATSSGVDVLYDDMPSSPGQKFASADLVGVPYQIIIGKRGLQNGEAEVKDRKTGKKIKVPTQKVVALVCEVDLVSGLF